MHFSRFGHRCIISFLNIKLVSIPRSSKTNHATHNMNKLLASLTIFFCLFFFFSCNLNHAASVPSSPSPSLEELSTLEGNDFEPNIIKHMAALKSHVSFDDLQDSKALTKSVKRYLFRPTVNSFLARERVSPDSPATRQSPIAQLAMANSYYMKRTGSTPTLESEMEENEENEEKEGSERK
jgi:hypothetical protein